MADNNGNTSLHRAAKKGHLFVVMTLIAAKANFFLKNNEGKTPLDLAKNKKIKQYIINHPWYRRRPLVMIRPYTDHRSNQKHRMTALAWILTAKVKGQGTDVLLFDLKRVVASFL